MLYDRNGIYWCKFKHRGELHRESTDVRADEPDAERRAREQETLIRARIIREKGPGGRQAKETVSLAVIAELDKQRAEAEGCTPEHVKALGYVWDTGLFPHLGGEHRDASTLTLADLAGHEKGRRAQGRPGQTIVRERQALVRGLIEAVNKEMLPALPFDPNALKKMKRGPKSKARKGILHTDDFIANVLAHLSAKAITQGHLDMCRLLMFTGMRISELQRSPGFQVTPTEWGAILHVRSSKEGTEETEERDIPLSPGALAIYLQWKHRFAKADLDDSLARAKKKLGLLRGVIPRDFRVWYGSNVARLNLPDAQKLLGHSKVATTSIYVQAHREQSLRTGLAITSSARVVTQGGTTDTEQTKKPRKNMRDAGVEPAAYSSGGYSNSKLRRVSRSSSADVAQIPESSLASRKAVVTTGGHNPKRVTRTKRGAS